MSKETSQAAPIAVPAELSADLVPYLQRNGRHPAHMGGTQQVYAFPNGRGASVVQTPYTYGGPDGLWELAVLDRAGRLDYTTPITSDVVGYQTWAEIEELLRAILALPAEEGA